MVVIRVDTREPKENYHFLKQTFPHLSIERVTLKEGDYESDKVIIERKTIADLYGSMIGPNKRIQNQIERISCHSDKVQGLLITGNIYKFAETMKEAPIGVEVDIDAMFGLIGSIACRYGIQPFWIEHEHQALIVMVKFMMKVEQGKWLVPVKRDPDILAARLLGITTRQLEQLLDNHGSIVGIANASSSELKRVRGIGDAKVAEIKRVLT